MYVKDPFMEKITYLGWSTDYIQGDEKMVHVQYVYMLKISKI